MLCDIDNMVAEANSVLGNDPLFLVLMGSQKKAGIKSYRPGVYDGAFNLDNFLKRLCINNVPLFSKIDHYPLSDKMREAFQREESPKDMRSEYGVADSIEQILEYFKPEIDDPDNLYIIDATTVTRDPENKGKGGGWRWHKWGPYIGTFDHQCEYLDDEEGIDSVICFHLHRVEFNGKGE